MRLLLGAVTAGLIAAAVAACGEKNVDDSDFPSSYWQDAGPDSGVQTSRDAGI